MRCGEPSDALAPSTPPYHGQLRVVNCRRDGAAAVEQKSPRGPVLLSLAVSGEQKHRAVDGQDAFTLLRIHVFEKARHGGTPEFILNARKKRWRIPESDWIEERVFQR